MCVSPGLLIVAERFILRAELAETEGNKLRLEGRQVFPNWKMHVPPVFYYLSHASYLFCIAYSGCVIHSSKVTTGSRQNIAGITRSESNLGTPISTVIIGNPRLMLCAHEPNLQ